MKNSLEIIYLIGNLALIFSQLKFSDQIRQYLGFEEMSITFMALMFASVVFSITISITLYVYRYSIFLIRWYPSKKKAKEYKYSQIQIQQKFNKGEEISNSDIVEEPFNVNIFNFSIILVCLAVLAFLLTMTGLSTVLRSIYYLLSVLLVVSCFTIQSLQITEQILYNKKLKDAYVEIDSRISKYLAPDYRVIKREQLPEGGIIKVRTTIKTKDGKKYKFTSKRDLPDEDLCVEEPEDITV